MLRVGLNRLASCQQARTMSTAASSSKLANGVVKFKEFLGSEQTKKALKAAAVELRPPTPMEIPKAMSQLVRMIRERNWKNVTVRDAWRNALVTTEVICWFFVGECIGKGTLIGYQV